MGSTSNQLSFIKIKYFIAFFLFVGLISPAASALDSKDIDGAKTKWQGCVNNLNGRLKAMTAIGRGKDLKIHSLKDRERYQECAELKRDWSDLEAVRDFTQDLVNMYKANIPKITSSGDGGLESEAEFIARALVLNTKVVGERFKMVGSPLFNNFLIYTRIKKEGYCYHWLPYFFDALSKRELDYFEKYWGGASIGRVTENNAVVITPKGVSLETGIVYDPWRGASKPYWRNVKGDSYKWVIRYRDGEIEKALAQFKRQ